MLNYQRVFYYVTWNGSQDIEWFLGRKSREATREDWYVQSFMTI